MEQDTQIRSFEFWADMDTSKTSAEKIVEHAPKRVMFSLMGACNLRCWHCIRSDEVVKAGNASKSLVDYMLDEVIPKAEYLRIGGNDLGEQLVSNQFNYFFERLDRANLKEVHLITNLTTIDEEQARLIVEKVDLLEISLEGVGASYEKIRGFPWESFVKNIAFINDARSKNQQSRLKICLTACVLSSHLENLHKVFKLRKIGVDIFQFREYVPWIKTKESECLWHHPWSVFWFLIRVRILCKFNNIVYETDFLDKYNPFKPLLSDLRDCYLPWETISVGSAGEVSACCHDLNLAQIDPDNADLLTVMNSESFQSLRSTINTAEPYEKCLQCSTKRSYYNQDEKRRLTEFRKQASGFKFLYSILMKLRGRPAV